MKNSRLKRPVIAIDSIQVAAPPERVPSESFPASNQAGSQAATSRSNTQSSRSNVTTTKRPNRPNRRPRQRKRKQREDPSPEYASSFASDAFFRATTSGQDDDAQQENRPSPQRSSLNAAVRLSMDTQEARRKAIKEEELMLIARLDLDIQRAEEAKFLEQISDDIAKAELLLGVASSNVVWCYAPGDEYPQNFMEFETLPKLNRWKRRRLSSLYNQRHKGNSSLVQDEETVPKVRVVKYLPKAIRAPHESDQGSPPVPLFSTKMFTKKVLPDIRERLQVAGRPAYLGWNVKAQVHLDTPDPRSCGLVIECSPDVLDVVKDAVEACVRVRLVRWNLHQLLHDPTSKVVDISISRTGKLGVTIIESVPYADDSDEIDANKEWGLWVTSMREDSPIKKHIELCRRYRIKAHTSSPSGTADHNNDDEPHIKGGFAILAVDGISCRKILDLKNTKTNPALKDVPMILTLCFPDFITPREGLKWRHRGTKNAVDAARSAMQSYDPKSPERAPTISSTSLVASPVAGEAASASLKEAGSPTRHDTSDTEQAAANTLNNDDDESMSNVPQISARNKSEKLLQSFHSFGTKIRKVCKLEYHRTGASVKTAKSSMWSQHKDIFGPDSMCDEDCLCLFHLPQLTEYVLVDVEVSMRKKDHNFSIDNMPTPTGFVSHFAKRFVPLLRKEYPKEKPEQIMKRLTDMWPLHQGQRNFGLFCKEDCPCDQGWDPIFNRGDPNGLSKQAISSAALRDLDTIQHTNRNGSSLLQKIGRSLPKESGRPLDFNLAHMLAKLPEKERIPRKVYEVTLQSSKSLGAYFETRQLQASCNVCRVLSVWDQGQIKEDFRIQSGTIVLDAFPKGDIAGIGISTSSDLKSRYDLAKRNARPLCLRLINPTDMVGVDIEKHKKNWTSAGAWQGKASHGWAGGSSTNRYSQPRKAQTQPQPQAQSRHDYSYYESSQGRDNIASSAERMGLSHPEFRSSSASNGSSVGPNSLLSVQKVAQPSRKNEKRQRAPVRVPQRRVESSRKKSILRKRDGNGLVATAAVGKKVSMHLQNNEHRLYFPEHAASESIGSSVASNLERNALAQLSLKEAVRGGTVEDVISVLQGPNADNSITDKDLSVEYSTIKRILAIPAQLREIEQTEEDLQLKRKVLNIYLNCYQTIVKGLSLRSWRSFEFWLRAVHVTKLQNVGQTMNGQQRTLMIKFQNGNKSQHTDLDVAVPEQELTSTGAIKYGNDETGHIRVLIHNNSSITTENRELRVVMCISPKSSAQPPQMLCSIPISLDRVHLECPQTGWFKVCHSYSWRKEKAEMEGSVEFLVRRSKVTPDYMLSKQEQVTNKIKQLINDIDRFNSEDGAKSKIQLTADMKGPGCKSLLHAAVQLQRVDMVQDLLLRGADPHCKSDVGSPTVLAQQQRERVKDKIQKAGKDGEVSGRAEILRRYDAILHILRSRGGRHVTTNDEPYDPLDIGGFVRSDSDQDKHTERHGNESSTNQQMTDEALPSSAIPKLEPTWFLKTGKNICKNFSTPLGCRYGQSCKFAHFQKSLGPLEQNMGDVTPEQLSAIELDRKELKTVSGNDVYAAGYYDSQSHIYVPAMGLHSIAQSPQGVHFYKTVADAENAIKCCMVLAEGVSTHTQQALNIP